MTTEPSPTAEATRFTEPRRTSPTAKMPGTLVSCISRSFAARLAQHVSVPVVLHDERFTSKLADHTTAATGTATSRDSLAASHLLESWMEAERR